MKWIKVTERLPEGDDKVLFVLRKDYLQLTGWLELDDEDTRFKTYSCGCCYPHYYQIEDVLAWMPIPPTPEGDK